MDPNEKLRQVLESLKKEQAWLDVGVEADSDKVVQLSLDNMAEDAKDLVNLLPNLDEQTAEIVKQHIQSLKSSFCGIPSATKLCLALSSPPASLLEDAKKRFAELMDKLQSGKISIDEFMKEAIGIIDSLPSELREGFGSYLKELKNTQKWAEFIGDMTALLGDKFKLINLSATSVDGLFKWLEGYAIGGEGAAYRALNEFIRHESYEMGFEFIATLLAIEAGMSSIPAALAGVVISKGIGDLLPSQKLSDEDINIQQ